MKIYQAVAIEEKTKKILYKIAFDETIIAEDETPLSVAWDLVSSQIKGRYKVTVK
jgi:hypothetical protein